MYSTPILHMFSIDRTPDEMKSLRDWAEQHCRGKIYHEDIFPWGVLATWKYLLGESNISPQKYYDTYQLGELVKSTPCYQQNITVDKPFFNALPELAPDEPLFQPKPIGVSNEEYEKQFLDDYVKS